MDNSACAFKIAGDLRSAGIRCETFVGNKKFGDQLKYADKRGAALVVMEGEDERNADPPQVTLKDLKAGAEASKSVGTREEWVGARAGQTTVPRAVLVAEVQKLLKRGV
jgi:histidyl-tRNA synthetase